MASRRVMVVVVVVVVLLVVVVVAVVERSGATAKFKVIPENEASHFSHCYPQNPPFFRGRKYAKKSVEICKEAGSCHLVLCDATSLRVHVWSSGHAPRVCSGVSTRRWVEST